MEVIGDLPRELFLEILLRLPVESLMRCKCVCKYWYALISNPKFIELHLKYNCNNNVCVLLKPCLVTCLGEKENMLSLVCSNGFSFVNLDVDLSLYKKEPCLQLLGHCDGIICLSNYRDDIVVCNPATRESMASYSPNSNLIPQTSALGFGYDAKTHHCKVVRIASYWEERSGNNLPHHSRVEVYSLATGSWKEIDVMCGILHVSRHTLMERFIGMLLTITETRGPKNHLRYGVRESWTKMLTIGPLTKVEMPLAFWKNDEILMEGSDGLVVSYNLKTQELKGLPIYGVPKSFATLVLVKGGSQMLDEGDNTDFGW
ncbi:CONSTITUTIVE EXPRESSER OF PR GENES 1, CONSTITUTIVE EXPRESSER OF PR GENES 30 [Hibiscus trionum]|uniref:CONSTITUTIVE EXPRESSER OF PR GENES 1, CONSTITUTIVE EXPRESSER OF PR GENES 30 n=1 Tax=Hibiscus trionum TaxID=183268 RepID=A0A9W7H0N1_HIBTR|nr:CONSTITUTIVE EXPRESSER OF PR GENES 1, CONSTITUTIVE EXPRESSER OF PR GENES 30 [Hibiscus trionum]